MADSSVAITAGAGTAIDTQVPTGGEHRQVVVIGDPNTVAQVATVDALGRVAVASLPPAATTGTRTSVTSSATDVLILAANTARLGAMVCNDSTASLYLGLGTTATTLTNYTVEVFADGFYEIPFGFTGQLRGIWTSANGAARVTELTA